MEADGRSVESLEREALWDKEEESKRESMVFWRVSRQIRFHKVRNISEG